MKNVPKILLLFGAIGFLAFVGCKPEECNEEVPMISFKSFERSADSARLTITFEDCNGDIGLGEDESEPPYDFNLFVEYLEFINNEWVKLEFGEHSDLRYRIPMLESNGNSDKLSGEIELALLNPQFGTADTVSYRIYILDRALNESNRITTPEIYFP